EQRAWTAFQRNPEADAWLESDGTRGLNVRGDLVFHVPRTAGETSVGLRDAYWMRCTVLPWSLETGSYEASPLVGYIETNAIGGTAQATHIATLEGEILGLSDGKSGQVFNVAEGPMLPLEAGETVQVEREDGSGWEEWMQVEDFSHSGPEDKHFICDPATGEILFGPAVRSANGNERHYGATPPPGVNIGLTSYRYGGGPLGNVGPNTLTTLRSSIPYVSSVANRRLASGGVPPESVDSAKLRGPGTLRTRNRAITEEDFEFLAHQASPSVMRARCIQPREVGSEGDPLPGVVRVLLVPTLPTSLEKTVRPDDLRLPRELVEQVQEYLDERRLLTTLLVVSVPEYSWISVEAKVRARQGADTEQVREDVEERLYRFIHPI
ncbi:MAG: putative baseplate assembly protein, partial [Ardenticatenaceae bacterium]